MKWDSEKCGKPSKVTIYMWWETGRKGKRQKNKTNKQKLLEDNHGRKIPNVLENSNVHI